MNTRSLAATLVAGLILTACTPADSQPKPIPLQQGVSLGKTLFPPGDTAQGGNGQPVDGIEASPHEMLKTHTHTHLSLFYRGEQIAIPEAIGIVSRTRSRMVSSRR